jgi:hypothetical protein
MDKTLTDLETLLPRGVEVTVGGLALPILPLKVGQLPAFLRAISPVMQQLSSSEINWLVLLGEHGEALLSAIAIATGKPRTWVDALAADEAVLLAATLIEVNADFFTRTVLPQVHKLFKLQTTAKVGDAGSTPPSDSSNTATA